MNLLAPLLAVAAAALRYVRVFRPWQLTWGATSEETRRPLPGDEVVADPTFDATRAITIAATPEQVWPWLLQVGVKRSGWYSYDILDNILVDASLHSTPTSTATSRTMVGSISSS